MLLLQLKHAQLTLVLGERGGELNDLHGASTKHYLGELFWYATSTVSAVVEETNCSTVCAGKDLDIMRIVRSVELQHSEQRHSLVASSYV